jgi:xanthine dehydrogenase accessory factor
MADLEELSTLGRARRAEMQAKPFALVKGAGDLGSGVALRLHRAGFAVAMTEISEPTVVRRTVAFAEAVYSGCTVVEGVRAKHARDVEEVPAIVRTGQIAILVDSEANCRQRLGPVLVVDAIMAKRNVGTRITDAPAVVALGPGFIAGVDVHGVVETKRGHTLGRVIWEGAAEPNTGVPGEVAGFGVERVLRSPAVGVFHGKREIGKYVTVSEIIGFVGDLPVRAGLTGILRGLIRSGLYVESGVKLGDVDPEATPQDCFLVSDKALAVGGGVLEASCRLLGGVRFENSHLRALQPPAGTCSMI